ncbi:DUF2851 family protein [Myroides odoratus]|uniref:Protein of uncharacterized function (DUF2851) n=1 Tax=Myroides odoratus TaxID=256 RepID=A0A378U3G1_MYROD|nr:DUF2851 family protein [Myroides odoratus]QQU03843.1 DUF2851 family protein [Myroides odoratus]STZ68872.1 Protein of uncharacterised function (DUF2851) [Myroides odoratus]
MKEAFVQYVWEKQLFTTPCLQTIQKQEIRVIDPGQWSTLAGPDFFNAQVSIDGQMWAGNVEIHLQSSDWFRHHHEQDSRYDNVILHVVWEYDTPVFNSRGEEIPTLVVATYVQPSILNQKERLFTPKATINCQSLLKESLSPIAWFKWKETLYVERLEDKAIKIQLLLQETTNDWNQVLWCFLAKNFGLNINGDAFLSIAKALPIQILLKEGDELLHIEALLFGMAGFLKEDPEEILDRYYWDLVKRWKFYQQKYQLQERNAKELHFFKLRPINFPTIRLAQLAYWFYHQKYNFAVLLQARDSKELKQLLQADVSPYWQEHYMFGKEGKRTTKRLSNTFQELVLLNTIIPMQYVFACHKGSIEDVERIVEMSRQLKMESNAITTLFQKEGVSLENAFDSQAMIQLNKNYCVMNKCLSCAVGLAILNKKN